jgi:pilus assembly protein CpaD
MIRRYLVAVGALLAVAACEPLSASYTTAEAPKAITLSNATAHFAVRFLPGSARLLPADAARLQALATAGAIAPGDRVTVAAAGSPALAAARVAALSQALLRYQIVVNAFSLPSLPPNLAVIDGARYLVTTPPCPNWSKSPDGDFTNTPASNWGCANTSNLALMAASPADLVSGRPLEPASGKVADIAVERYDRGLIPVPPSIVSLGTGTVGATPTVSSGGTSGP